MKLTTLIMTLCFLQVSALTKAQITLHENKVSLEKVLEKIGKQSGYDFIYSKQDFKDVEKLTVNLIKVPIEKALDICFSGQPLTYEITEKTVMVKRRKIIINRVKDFVANIDVKGLLMDADNHPLAGANVVVKGTGKGVKTNEKGEFYLQNIDENALIVISYIGYQTKELKVAPDLGTIKMTLADANLEQVVVTAFGIERQKKSLGYAVQDIKGDALSSAKTPGLLNAIAGKIAGVQVTSSSGAAGGSTRMQIRGAGSISSNINHCLLLMEYQLITVIIPQLPLSIMVMVLLLLIQMILLQCRYLKVLQLRPYTDLAEQME